jgi:uncharacterized protein (TIGR03083 family)
MSGDRPTDDRLQLIRTEIKGRTDRIVAALSEFDEAGLAVPSELPGWSRLTIACHLRYGAQALSAMTEATLAGRTASYYPRGRAQQRPSTLLPNAGERPEDVCHSLAQSSERLGQLWSSLDGAAGNREIREPADNPDLGSVSLGHLALLRLTEVQVHGSDLGLQLEDWSPFFVGEALRMRLEWLSTRRVNHREVDTDLDGSWLLVALDGPTYRISVSKEGVDSAPTTSASPARAVIEASSRDLLALLLGRPSVRPLRITGDTAFGEAFSKAFPGP